MRTPIQRMNRVFMLASAPFIGMLLFMLFAAHPVSIKYEADPLPPQTELMKATNLLGEQLDQAGKTAQFTITSIRKVATIYQKTTSTMNSIVKQSATQAARPEKIYNTRITKRLGSPKERIDSNNITMELFRINQDTYNGYALKIKLKDPKAMKMVLGQDKVGKSETTLGAVRRYGAAAGINAGGFADGGGSRYPLSTTMMNGKYVNGGFEPSYKDLSFVGLNKQGKLIGGKFSSKNQLDQLDPEFGATFVPVLLKNGVKNPIPDKWKAPRRAPRTVIGNYKDDQLLIMVIDGYNERGNSGATLEELQNKLANLGITDAFNLDGGGSSSLIFNGRIVNSPSDGQLRPVPTHFLFFK
ncbi:phosphodiester glycosidase family protein [Paenibacillus terrigena]|uniref:phosphodiester glycosidase family protein n=1 Tax=Paenibacillus terrigena TaxID=369333 RepID=UPI00036C1E71|nr:phosphodiester glycosidase family protein [Paenibacillus terrigena]